MPATKKLSTTQQSMINWLAEANLLVREDGLPVGQLKIRTARPLFRAGLVTGTTEDEMDRDAAAGGWVWVGLTSAGHAAATN